MLDKTSYFFRNDGRLDEKTYQLDVPDIGAAEEIEIVSWKLKEGDAFEDGDELCELVTQKSTFPLEAPFSGFIVKILASEGSIVHVGDPVGTVRRRSSVTN